MAEPSPAIRVESAVVNGHKIEFARHGTGSPAVVFSSGSSGGGPSRIASWEPWLSGLDTTAFAYDRPGMGKSEPANDQRTPAQVADELHALLVQVGIPPPYVLVGRSLGGLYSRALAMRFPADVAGLVLIDGSSDRELLITDRFAPAKFPLFSASDPGMAKPDYVGMAATFKSGRLDVGGKLPDVPMVVLTSLRHGTAQNPMPPEFEEEWRKSQEEIFQSTTHGMHIVTAKSGHDIGHDEPELVWNAIRWVLDAVRPPAKSPTPAEKSK
ncbi:MAG TPA: alpha/beta hydrolase [Opitutaceae bacterium]|nr:alpha/beta hydrolase [Opitutaceae bacterium]